MYRLVYEEPASYTRYLLYQGYQVSSYLYGSQIYSNAIDPDKEILLA